MPSMPVAAHSGERAGDDGAVTSVVGKDGATLEVEDDDDSADGTVLITNCSCGDFEVFFAAWRGCCR